MLDSEPGNPPAENPENDPINQAGEAQSAAPRRTRRRAASRPAGPPVGEEPGAGGPDAPVDVAAQADPNDAARPTGTEGDEPAPAKKTARRAAAKRTTKKAAAGRTAEAPAAAEPAGTSVQPAAPVLDPGGPLAAPGVSVAAPGAPVAESTADPITPAVPPVEIAPDQPADQPVEQPARPVRKRATRKTAAPAASAEAPAAAADAPVVETPAEPIPVALERSVAEEPAAAEPPSGRAVTRPFAPQQAPETSADEPAATPRRPAAVKNPFAVPDIDVDRLSGTAATADEDADEDEQAAAAPAVREDTAAATEDDDSDDDSEDDDSQDDDSDDSDDSDDDDSDGTDQDGQDGQGDGRRRRRRRGGRRRRRGSDDQEAGDQGDRSVAPAADRDAQQDTPGRAEQTADASEPDSDAESGSESGDDQSGGRGSRGGRSRGRRSSRRSSGDSDDEGGTGDEASAEDTSDETSDDEGSTEGEAGSRRRRRRRRRRGEGDSSDHGTDDPATEVVERVREPRSRSRGGRSGSTPSDTPTGIEGSTRMEAKRQRRREGRDAGRRRAPILSEAEFLARRESVDRKMIIRQLDDASSGAGGALAQIAVLEDGILVEHYVDRESATSLIGNVYLGRVQNVLPSMEAAFIDIGRGRNAVLYAGEVDWESFGAEGGERRVERVLKSGQTILVQVSKDPVGAKGARLTNHVSIPGRYLVYAPNGHLSGISRKLPETERKRLKDILAGPVGDTASVIVRTAAEGASEDELVRDVNRLKAQWADIETKIKSGSAPQQLYAEPDLTIRIVRDLFTEDFSELIIQGNGSMADAFDAVEGYASHVAPHLKDRIRRWDAAADGDLFGAYRLDEQIAKGLERKVFLPSGGSLIIDRTEAMTVIDVNTGKFTGSGGNLEATITSNNLEAAEEIVRQLRLRDIGGIIVIDFIDMVLPANRELLLRRLVECLGRDRTRHQVAEVTSLGLVQMTRKRIGTGLLEAFSSECPTCHGRGVELHDMPVETQKQADGGARDDHRRGGRGNDRSGKGGGNDRSDKGGGGNDRSDKGGGNDRSDNAGDNGGANDRTDDRNEDHGSTRSRRGRGRRDERAESPADGHDDQQGDQTPVAEPQIVTTEPIPSEPSQPEPSQPEPSQPEPSQPEPSQPEPSQPEPSQPAPTARRRSRGRATRPAGSPGSATAAPAASTSASTLEQGPSEQSGGSEHVDH